MGKLIKVARLSEMPPGTCRQVDAGGQAVAVFNVAGTIYAPGGKCAHRGGPLGAGELNGPVVLVHGTVRSLSTATTSKLTS